MSYSRFGEDSDVYIYLDVDGSIHCCGCPLEPTHGGNPNLGMQDIKFHGTKQLWKYSDAIEHVKEHLNAGHRVPDYVIERLQNKILTLGDDTSK